MHEQDDSGYVFFLIVFYATVMLFVSFLCSQITASIVTSN